MSRDGLLPKLFSAVHKTYKTRGIWSTWMQVSAVGIPALLVDIGDAADLSKWHAFAFVLVSLGVILLRRKQPDRPRRLREFRWCRSSR